VSNLINRFSLHPTDWNGWVGFALILIWACVVACVISSILTQPFDRAQRTFWIAIVIVLPLLGILAYLPFAFRKENLPHIFLRRGKHQHKPKELPEDTEP